MERTFFMAKHTLQINNFLEKQNFVEKEHQVLAFWDSDNTFEQSVTSRPADKRYVFYDGPPFATGTPHYGHILASTIKDVIPRYWTMKGFRVDRVWGWDCHGIPIENMIEKELDLKGGKKGIEALGIDKFNAACRAAILRFDTEWEQVIRRIGRWVDFKHSYKTMDKTYMESVWWAFKTLYEKDLVYEGKKVILYCSRCATPLSNFEIAMDNSYKELPGPSTTYKYKVQGKEHTYLLAWSTTPWNKLATPALAVHPTITYVEVEQGGEQYILAETRLEMLTQEPYTIVKRYTGKELEQYTFELHYDFYPRKNGEKAGVVIADEYVTDGEGTGIVTLAIYGEDDYRVMTANNIQLVEHVDSEGKLKAEVTPWAGVYILKVNPFVNEDLAKRGLIYTDEERIHNVPVCYRCETRLYHAPVPAWFINIQKLKPELVAQNEAINWFPDHLKQGRFGKGLETAPDWNISRSRYWGTPMPVWVADNPNSSTTLRIIGSVDELKQWAVEPEKVTELTDIHREFLDDIEVWIDDKRTVKGRRIPEVFDCWVESGSMPYASIHYPFEHKELFEQTHPAQFIAEYIAQTRAWFYTLHVMSVGLFGTPTFENAVTTGTILAEDGQKMSKSKKNYPDPALLFEKYGVDALRFYLMGSVVMKAENLNFSETAVREVYQKVISLLWNTFSFFKLYAQDTSNMESVQIVKQLQDNTNAHIMDRWIVSRTTAVIDDVTKAMDAYDTATACRFLQQFLDDLSTWYLRRSRERCKTNQQSYAVFGWVLKQTVLLLAPVTPFISELIWQNMGHTESVHLQNWPITDQSLRLPELEAQMGAVRSIVTAGHAWRKEQGKAVKQQLRRIQLTVDVDVSWLGEHQALIEVIGEELNVLEIELQGTVYNTLNAAISDEELEWRNLTRSIIRKVQSLRKEQHLGVNDLVAVQLPKEYSVLPKQYLDEIVKTTVASTLSWGDSFVVSTL